MVGTIIVLTLEGNGIFMLGVVFCSVNFDFLINQFFKDASPVIIFCKVMLNLGQLTRVILRSYNPCKRLVNKIQIELRQVIWSHNFDRRR